MSAEPATEAPATGRSTAVYVYGIVPADVQPEERASGVGDPPGKVSVVRHGEVAALVSEVPAERPLGTPTDLTAHAELLDGSAAVVPVLPLRFGAVMTDTAAVEKELLEANHEEFRAALEQLEGRAQFVIKGRYVEEQILRELLDANPQAGRLREEIRDKPEDATRDARMALGELINQGVEAARVADTRRVIDMLAPFDPMVNERRPTHEEDAVHIAVLLDLSRQGELEEMLGSLAQEWDGRVVLSLLGPMAAYDFVMKREPEG
ncbi:GvpL/GvpF family gas vesicle protein [Nocardia donostiensis]|uniref:Gas vesicle protein GvpFL n=1 Tax=Nocardia donostiensis TaxID=1538463 RepID=A0A1W0BC33_9NOCA|nr:GvpL/GvpF family gas vesicle protein [Nocardia donostiensis]ONM47079.1 gas vesicle protein GvpFL [Nocardia donostiensis]OQS15250.1 gas vesicle protein GvpFL [Nocardia donostiensis]OQS20064.1 gas vesicle protein GvpFL [Nocardia donostiensis]